MSSTVQKSFRLPADVAEKLESVGNITEYVVTALREKFDRDEIDRFRVSAIRLVANREERDVAFAFEAQAEVVRAG